MRRITFIAGLSIVALWTIFRHISNGVNYDVVGQIGVARLWANGMAGGAEFGATHYVLKLPLYFIVNSLSFLSPFNKLLILALICNLLTFGLLFVLYEKIVKLLGIKVGIWLYVPYLWLTTIAGNVFWLDYANSRNLETVGGIFYLYMLLAYIKHATQRKLLLVALIGGVLFYSDSLQLYVCGVSACVYVIYLWLSQKTASSRRNARLILISVIASFILAKLFTYVTTLLLPVKFLAVPFQAPELTLHAALLSIGTMLTSTLKIFGANFVTGPYGISTIRELLNAVVLISIVGLIIKFRASIMSHKAHVLIVVGICVNYLMYAASGQALQADTARYLIMVPLLFTLTATLLIYRMDSKVQSYVLKSMSIVVCLGVIMLIGALTQAWPERHSKDKWFDTLASYMSEHEYRFALSSREIGVSGTYILHNTAVILPMACSPEHTIYPTNLFFDKAVFTKFRTYKNEVPVIVPPSGIKYLTNCTEENIINQFGPPGDTKQIEGVGNALIYKAEQLQAKL